VADADVVIAACDATFLDPHVSVGQVSAYESIGLLFKMPAEPVIRMALLGRAGPLSAPRAYTLGLVSQVVDPPEHLRAQAQELAERIAQHDTAALATTKAALWRTLETRRPATAPLQE
jgi:enoyl-CoA hydratase/carnithine racemase